MPERQVTKPFSAKRFLCATVTYGATHGRENGASQPPPLGRLAAAVVARRRRHTGVPRELLHRREIDARTQQVPHEGAPHDFRRQLRHPSLALPFREDAIDRVARQAGAADRAVPRDRQEELTRCGRAPPPSCPAPGPRRRRAGRAASCPPCRGGCAASAARTSSRPRQGRPAPSAGASRCRGPRGSLRSESAPGSSLRTGCDPLPPPSARDQATAAGVITPSTSSIIPTHQS